MSIPPRAERDANPPDLSERISIEARRFRELLPTLLADYAGRWVVFRDGTVESAHATEEEAYLAGIERFGLEGGHLVAEVRKADVVTVGSGSVFL